MPTACVRRSGKKIASPRGKKQYQGPLNDAHSLREALWQQDSAARHLREGKAPEACTFQSVSF